MLHTSRGQLLPAHTRSQLPAAWLGKARRAATPLLTTDWELSTTELAALHANAATGQVRGLRTFEPRQPLLITDWELTTIGLIELTALHANAGTVLGVAQSPVCFHAAHG